MKLFNPEPIRNDDNYKKVLQGKNRLYGGMILIGLLSVGSIYFGKSQLAISDHVQGFYTGMGLALVLVGGIMLFRNCQTLKRPQKIHQERVKNNDERNLMLATKAFHTASTGLLACLYVASLVGIFFEPLIVTVALSLIGLFFIIYLISYRYFKRYF